MTLPCQEKLIDPIVVTGGVGAKNHVDVSKDSVRSEAVMNTGKGQVNGHGKIPILGEGLLSPKVNDGDANGHQHHSPVDQLSHY